MTQIPPDSQFQDSSKASNFFRELASRKVERPDAPPLYTRKAALILGATLGLVYGLSTQFINTIFTPGIPYTHYPFGIVGNCVASMLGMMLVSFVCALPKDVYRGALFGSFTTVLVLEIRAVLLGMPLLAQFRTIFWMFAAIGLLFEIVLSLPVMLGLRWTIEIQGELFNKPVWSWKRARLPLAFIIGVISLSIFSIYPDDVRAAMADTVTLIKEGRAAPTDADLPAPLRSENNVQDFRSHAASPYTLELGEKSILANDISTAFPGSVVVVIARFGDGWGIACAYLNGLRNPTCISYSPGHAPPVTDYRAMRLAQLV